jgi:hypothetical protein
MADDFRNIQGARGGAGASHDANLGEARKSGNASVTGAADPDFLASLDAFSRKVDEEQKAHERAEAERRKEEEEAQRKAEAERVRQAQARNPEAGNQGVGRRFAALEMLRKQAASRPTGDDMAARRAQARPLLNKNVLASMHYLAEFAKELNEVLPTTESTYGFAFLQQGPKMVLSKAFADYRLRKIDGEDVCDHAYLKYHARYAQTATVNVTGTDVEYCRRFLAMSRVPFEFSASKQNDFGQAVSGTFTLYDAIPCEIYIRADYDAPAVVIELLNVGRLGAGRSLLAPATFDVRVVDEIAKYVLGSDNEFARLVIR